MAIGILSGLPDCTTEAEDKRMIYAVIAGILETIMIAFCWQHYKVIVWREEKKSKAGVLLVGTAVLAIILNGMLWQQQYRPTAYLNISIIFVILAIAAGIDYKSHIIPNRLLFVGILLRLLLLGAEAIWYPDYVKQSLLMSAAGFVFGLLLLLVLTLITRHGIGYGDVKLFAWLGLCLGMADLYYVLFYSVLFTAVAGIFLLLFKKADKKKKLPFAPFVFMGSYSVFMMLLLP